ncbi:MAG: hypothetical protein GXO25_07585 [Euryarchaeota archaeon]|nr:hypothetical protein [Euryarchaeota archaeon]
MRVELLVVLILGVLLFSNLAAGTEELKVTLKWESGKLMGWLDEAWGIAVYDVNGDGVKDILVPVNGNNVTVFSGKDFKPIEKFKVANDSFLSYLFNYEYVAQMDSDSDKELVLGAVSILLGNIFVVDLKTHEVKMHLTTPGGTMDVCDVDGDGVDEIITADSNVSIYRVGHEGALYRSGALYGFATSMTVANVGGHSTLFVATSKDVSSDILNPKYVSRIYEFTLPDLKVVANFSAGDVEVNSIAVGTVNGNFVIFAGCGEEGDADGVGLYEYSTTGKLLKVNSDAGAVQSVRFVDMQGYRFLLTGGDSIQMFNVSTLQEIWCSDTLYDAGEKGGLVVSDLANNGTLSIITRAYDYTDGGRVYVYSVSKPVNQSASGTTPAPSGGEGQSGAHLPYLYIGLALGAVAVAVAVAVVMARKHARAKGGEAPANAPESDDAPETVEENRNF